MCHFWDQNGPFVINKNFLVQTIIITFISLLTLFIVQNLKKFLQPIQSYEDTPFLGPKWSICPKQIFFLKIINIILMYLFAPLKFLQIQSDEDTQFLDPKWPISPNENIFQKTCYWTLLLSFMPIYMPQIKVRY